MNNQKRVVLAAVILSLPVMLFFQNCANQASMQAVEMSNVSKMGPVDSNTLPLNQEIIIDENNVPKESSTSEPKEESSDGRMDYQLVNREAERQENINEALDLCQQAMMNESQNDSGEISAEPVVISGVRGSKFISPNDIGGATKISRIENSYGKIILCGVEVDKVESSGGGLILVGSKVNQIVSFQGHIDLVDGSAVIDSSNVKVFRTSTNGALAGFGDL